MSQHQVLGRGDRDAWPRNQDAGQVQRVGGADPHPHTRAAVVGAVPAGPAQRRDGFGQRELFPGEGGDELAADHLAAHLQPPQDEMEIAPARGDPLALQEFPEEHAPAPEKLARYPFMVRRFFPVAARREERPAAG